MPRPDYRVSILVEVSDAATSAIKDIAENSTSQLRDLAKNITKVGAGMSLATAPLVAGFADAVNVATDFESQMADLQTILGATDSEMGDLRDSLLDFGQAARAGPRGVAAAFAEIAGGVEDTSVHMAILEAAISTAHAGQADLIATTNALVSVMNSYGGSAEFAAQASDILTQTVAMGVGSMEEFGAALPQITGLASSLGVDFENLGAAAAYLTTKGFSASQAATQLQGAMSALIKPNAIMTQALQELGFASGQAAIEQLGLVGTFEALKDGSATFQSQTAAAVGQVEALNGVVALTGGTFEEFEKKFIEGAKGMTAAAEQIQLDTVAAQTDILNSQIETLRISIGLALLPAINKIVGAITPVVKAFSDWARNNPKLVTAIAAVVGVVSALGAALASIGGVILLVTPALPVLGAALALLTGPIGLTIAAVAALAAAWKTDFLGIRSAVMPIIDEIGRGLNGIAKTFGINLNLTLSKKEGAEGEKETVDQQAGRWIKEKITDPLNKRLKEISEDIGLTDWWVDLRQQIRDKVKEAIESVDFGELPFPDLINNIFQGIADSLAGKVGGGSGGLKEPAFELLPAAIADKINNLKFGEGDLNGFADEAKEKMVAAVAALSFNVADFANVGNSVGGAMWDSIIGGINVNIPIKIPAATAAIGGGFGGADLGSLRLTGQGMGAAILEGLAGHIGLNANSAWVLTKILPPITNALGITDMETVINTSKRIAYNILDGIRRYIAGDVDMNNIIRTDVLSPIAVAISTVSSEIADSAKLIGVDLMLGIVEGIWEKWEYVKSQLEALAGLIPEPVKKILGSRSPSTVMMEVGRDVVEGLKVGIDDSSGGIADLGRSGITANVDTSALAGAGTSGDGGATTISISFDGAQFSLPNINDARDFLAWLQAEAERQNLNLTTRK